MRIGLCIMLLLLTLCQMSLAQTTLTSGKLSVSLTPDEGVTAITFDGQPVLIGSSTHFAGSLFTLLRNTPTHDWNWPANRDTQHYAPSVGKLVDKVGHWKPHKTKVIRSDSDRYVVEHHFEQNVTVTFDHQLIGPDLILNITVNNQSPDSFQLDDWMLFFVKPKGPAKITHRMGSYYPAGDVYSPVTTISSNTWGLGINWVEHDLRPVEIIVNPRERYKDYQLRCWLKNSPIPSGASSRYTMVLRIGDQPGDWKYLLEPYRKWFAEYFGPVRYSMDFRVKAGVSCCSVENVSPSNPLGLYGQMDRQGWLPYLKQRVGHLRNFNTGQVLIWGATGISSRGVNYRPDFDVLPPVLQNGLDQLKPFFHALGDKQFGFFSRPNTIAYQKSFDTDGDVAFNPQDLRQVRMADARYDNLRAIGATAFYLDTYGADWGNFPDAAKASVFYLKHLREKLGPDTLLVTEFGFDAFSVYVSIWPNIQDESGHKPYGEITRWLVPGSVDFCRVLNVSGAKRVWEQGAVPMVNDFMVNGELMQVQDQFVNPDGTSKVRSDCLVPANKPVLLAPMLPANKTPPAQKQAPVESLFK